MKNTGFLFSLTEAGVFRGFPPSWGHALGRPFPNPLSLSGLGFGARRPQGGSGRRAPPLAPPPPLIGCGCARTSGTGWASLPPGVIPQAAGAGGHARRRWVPAHANRGVSTNRPTQGANVQCMYRQKLQKSKKVGVQQSSRLPPERRDFFAPKAACVPTCTRAAASDALCAAAERQRVRRPRGTRARVSGATRSRVPA